MKKTDISKIANKLFKAKEEINLTSLPSKEYEDFSLSDGYGVGAEIHQRTLKKGFRSVGRKIGFTNKDTWKEFKLKTPIWAYMYDKTVLYAKDGKAEISLKNMVAPRIEPEVIIRLRNGISLDKLKPLEMLSSIEWVAIGFEIVDCHYPKWEFTAADAVADFGFHANLIIGPPLLVKDINLGTFETQLREFQVILRKDNMVVSDGKGENALGSPLLALSHLAEVLNQQTWAGPLSKGEVITTGTLTPLPSIKSGDTWSTEIKGINLQPLSVLFTL